MIQYSLEVAICWSALYLIYICFLKKETFFGINRTYLMSSLLIGLIIPLVRMIDWSWQEQLILAQPLEYISTGPAIIATAIQPIDSVEMASQWQLMDVIQIIYVLGVLFMGFRLLKGIYKIHQLYASGTKTKMADYTLVETSDYHLPFSFLRFVFFSKDVLLTAQVDHIMKHELTHIKSRHSYDVFFLELLHVLFWWNPLIYLYKKELRQVHEYLADAMVLEDTDKKIYGRILLGQSNSGLEIALTHQFFHSHLKKRITMMYKNKSKRSALVKYLLALPLIFGMVILFSSHRLSNDENINQKLENKLTQFFSSHTFECDGNTLYDFINSSIEEFPEEADYIVNKIESQGASWNRLVSIDINDGIFVSTTTLHRPLAKALNDYFITADLKNDHSEIGHQYNELRKEFSDSWDAINNRFDIELKSAGVAFAYGEKNGDACFKVCSCGFRTSGLLSLDEINEMIDGLDEIELYPADLEPNETRPSSEEELRSTEQNTDQKSKENLVPGRIGLTYNLQYDGLTVTSIIKGSSADKMGLMKGDVITKVNDVLIEDMGDLQNIMEPLTLGNYIQLQYKRSGRVVSERIKLITPGRDGFLVSYANVNQISYPRFPGCEEKNVSEDEKNNCAQEQLLKYLYENIIYPKSDREKNIQGLVMVDFTIDIDGSVTDIEIVKDIGGEAGQSVMSLIHSMNTKNLIWKPAVYERTPTAIRFSLPIKFVLEDESTSVIGDRLNHDQEKIQSQYKLLEEIVVIAHSMVRDEEKDISADPTNQRSLTLYEGKSLSFDSEEEELEYINKYDITEVLIGDEGYKRFGKIALGRDTVFNRLSSSEPRFPGCEESNLTEYEKDDCANEKFIRYLYENVLYAKSDRENNIRGLVLIDFTIDIDGSITDVEIVHGIGGQAAESAKSLIQSMNNQSLKWKPATLAGSPIAVRYSLPIKFKLNATSYNPDQPLDDDYKLYTHNRLLEEIVVVGYLSKQNEFDPSDISPLYWRINEFRDELEGSFPLMVINGNLYTKRSLNLNLLHLQESQIISVDYQKAKQAIPNYGDAAFHGAIVIELSGISLSTLEELGSFYRPREGSSKITEKEEVFGQVEQMPKFPDTENLCQSVNGSIDCHKQLMLNFINNHLTVENEGTDQTVVVEFIINKEGEIIEPVIIESGGITFDQKALYIVQLMNNLTKNWTPGQKDGQDVNVLYSLPILFRGNMTIAFNKAESIGLETHNIKHESEFPKFILDQNSPNPVKDFTTIVFELPEAARASITFYNTSGTRIMTYEQDFDQGRHELRLDKSELNTHGIVYYQLEANGKVQTKTMIVVE